MSRTFLLVLLLTGGLVAQNLPTGPDRRVVQVKNLSGERLQKATELLDRFLKPTGDAAYYESLGSILLRGNAESVSAAEALLKRFDTPAGETSARKLDSQIRFRIYLVEASPDEGKSGPMPAEIQSAVDQMKQSFQYRSYTLIDTILMPVRGMKGGDLSGFLPGQSVERRILYQVRMQTVTPADDMKSVSVQNFRFAFRVPTRINDTTQYLDAALETDLNIARNQKVVVGKLSTGELTGSIFLIVTTDLQ